MIKFTLRSNNIDTLSNLADGWLLSDIYIGYDKATDFLDPNIKFNNLNSYDTVYSTYIINVKISDNDKIDDSRINIYIDDENVYGENFKFNEDSGILKYKWDTTEYENGEHEIKVIAYDKEGNEIEKTITVVVDNSILNLKSWPQWVIYSIIGIIIGTISCIILIKNQKFRENIVFYRKLEKESGELKDKKHIRSLIEDVEAEELERPITLYCKRCKSWFSTEVKNFDIMCPECGMDQIHVAYNCLHCHQWFFKDEPRENYYCPKCTPSKKIKSGDSKKYLIFPKKEKIINTNEGIRLIRRKREDVDNLLFEEGKFLKKFERKKQDFDILEL
jgi:Zn finger protein HypA/HybF involved in hydrogenase expression